MKLNSITRLSLLSLTITTLLLIGSSIDFSSKDAVQAQVQNEAQGVRSLLDDAVISDICSKASDDLQEIYKNETFDYETKENKYAETLRTFINNSTLDNFLPYLPRIIPFVIFILIGIFTIVGWFVCCCCCYCCCCCPCCCCKQKENENCCRSCSFVVSLIMLGGIVVGAVAGLAYSGIFIQGINGTTCSMMKFYQELKNGEEKETTPKWLGIEGISNTIMGTIGSVDVIQEKSQHAYDDVVLQGNKDFESKLSNSFDTFKINQLVNPDPKTIDSTIDTVPVYITNYGPYDEKTKILNRIFQEYDYVVNNGVKEVLKTKRMTTQINNQADAIKGSLADANNQITDLSNTFDDSVGTVIDQLESFQGKFNEYANLVLYLFFGIFLFVGILSIVLVSVYVGKCCYCGRGVLHLFWNFFALLSIITFLVGSILGIIGIIGEDGSSILAYTFSKDNLDSAVPFLIGKSETLYTCLIGDGDLSKSFGLSDGSANQLDQLYQMSDTIKTTKAELQKHLTSQSIQVVNDKLNEYGNNFMLSSTEAKTSITQLNRYTNGHAPNTYQTTPSKFDIWVASQSDCGGASSSVCREIEITEGEETTFASPYADVDLSGSSSEYSKADEAAKEYFTRLNKYNSENKELTQKLINNNNGQIKNQYEKDVMGLDKTLDNVNGVINPLITVYGDVAGDNSIFSIINCKFLRKSLDIFIYVMGKDLGNKTTVIAAFILAISFCETLSIIFVLIVLLRYKSQYIKEKKEEEINTVIEPDPKTLDLPEQKQPEDIGLNSEEQKPQDLPVPILEKGDI